MLIFFSLENANDHVANNGPPKKGKISHEESETERESLGGRPRRQASKVSFHLPPFYLPIFQT